MGALPLMYYSMGVLRDGRVTYLVFFFALDFQEIQVLAALYFGGKEQTGCQGAQDTNIIIVHMF